MLNIKDYRLNLIPRDSSGAPASVARSKGVLPSESLWSRQASFSSNALTTSRCPSTAWKCKAVRPRLSVKLTSTPAFANPLMISGVIPVALRHTGYLARAKNTASALVALPISGESKVEHAPSAPNRSSSWHNAAISLPEFRATTWRRGVSLLGLERRSRLFKRVTVQKYCLFPGNLPLHCSPWSPCL